MKTTLGQAPGNSRLARTERRGGSIVAVGRVVTGPQKQNDNQPESSYVFLNGQTKPDFGLIIKKKRVQNHGHNRPLIALV